MRSIRRPCCAIILVVICIMGLYGCGKEAHIITESLSTESIGTDEFMITTTDTFYPFDAGCSVDFVAQSCSVLMIAGDDESGYRLCTAPYNVEDGRLVISSPVMLSLDQPEAVEESVIYGLTGDDDGFFYVLAGEQPITKLDPSSNKIEENNPNFSGQYCVLKYDTSGTFLEKCCFRYVSPYGAPMRGIVVTEDGQIVVYTASEYVRIDWSGAILYAAQDDQLQLFGIQVCDQGLLASCWNNNRGNNGPCTVQIFSDGSYEFLSCPEASLSPCQSQNGLYLLNDGRSFISYNFKDGTAERTDWANGERGGMACVNVCQLSDHVFAYTVSDSDALYTVCRRPENRENYNVVRVAIFGADDAARYLAELNSAGGDYYYEYEIYDPWNQGDEDRLIADIIGPDCPDLVLFDENLDTSSTNFADLYPFLDADPVLNRDCFIPNILSALEVRQELHEIWSGAEIWTLAIREQDMNEENTLSIQEYEQILEENEQYVSLFQSFMTRTNLLGWVASIAAGEYVDKETGSCHFDDPAFAELLEWCLEMPPDYTGDIAPVYYDITEVVLSLEQIGGATRLPVIRNNFQGPFVFVGFPNGKSNGNYYSCAHGCAMAIPAAAMNKDGAWNYIRTQLLQETQMRRGVSNSIPTNMAAFERLVLTPAEKGDDELLLGLVNATEVVITHSQTPLREIIFSAGQAYLTGDRSLEDTVDIIQSRASIYVAEKYSW